MLCSLTRIGELFNPMQNPNEPITILLVEDEPITRDLVTVVLERHTEYKLIVAEDGEQALSAFEEYQPRVVLLDILLPVMNGLEVLKRLKDGGHLARTSVIMTSALGYEEIIQKAMTIGASDFIVKPFDVALLLSRIRKSIATMEM